MYYCMFSVVGMSVIFSKEEHIDRCVSPDSSGIEISSICPIPEWDAIVILL